MIISKQQFLNNKKVYIKKIKQGSVFIYPTDTIYGLGCISTNKKSINKIKELKQRTNKPFSIIVKEIDIPIITTSVNISSERHMTSLKDLNKGIKSKVDFIIYLGRLNNKPSKIINLITDQITKR